MCNNYRLTVTLLPEWEEQIDKLKKEKFYDRSKSELLRYLIQLGLDQSQNPKSEKTA